MILITGATGAIGGAVTRQLLTRIPPTEIAALVRDPAKAAGLQSAGVSIRTGDYDDKAALAAAMEGIDKVLLVSGGDADNGLQQHYNVVDAAKAAGVSCIAYTSRCMREPATLVNQLMHRHFDTEDYIRESGMQYVIFRNMLYMDTIPRFVGPKVLETGIRLPEGRVSFALRREMGEAIANVLAAGECNNRVYDFTGMESYSFADVAAALSELNATDVPYTAIDIPEFEARMRSNGIPESFIPRMSGFVADIRAGQESTVSPDLETVLGRRPVNLHDGLRELYNL